MKTGILLLQAGDSATRENILCISQREPKKKTLTLFGYSNAFCGLSNPRHHMPLPVQYQTVFDPLETITYLAANTDVSLVTCLIDMLFHNQVILARRFTTLDILSHGRVIAGLGIGWSKDEYEASGVRSKQRGGQMNFCNC